MGLFDRIKRVVSSNLNDLVNKAEDPEKMLEQAILEMQEDLVQLRQGVAQAIAAQKRSEKQYNDAQNEINKWQRNAQLALQKGDENLARQALERKKTYTDTSAALKASLDTQSTQVETLKRNLIQLESKISEAKTKKEMLKARITTAKAQEQLQGMVRGMNTSSAMSAFERMEEKVLMQESRAQALGELAGADLETQFAQLEGGSDVDDELAALKAQMLPPATPVTQAQLPPQQETTPAKSNEVVDAELDSLRKQLDQL
ncbi:PspA/IM30 family protein [Nostoc sp. UCD121]|jgi:phage shock protein A|uniref:Membrane-associated protein Vipp1 n=4 Tax=Nostoc punctiforme TaxID=272131 RepID=VIPP1_NOSP7|nr:MULTISPECIES: PspA/IM30 family protein [Nostoc]B2J6D9.1 RecName: Full=Membrane-associated protein Vipp1; AltName: Full=Vesicle-inducing protein in plastids 1; Short=Vipp1 [Nostoc punctiforme PCC 73102]6ZVR_A Chain A, Vipp1 [Nostoc punctiforme]6ZVR_AA Chain AA, Vipp1 [Nostoc punctiforme]6ZVR_AB Chain AB, Vipp1 [Nostoc punctiforme]6ZVR_B Chain B, Vipp1 [Nostoc punctiforme]6ZVR_BA Chain BA, Vipp1 [Nostoc punctiforme]6ZVR_BB Chain BB, Vipp1 [Nostoc punctiforme]6ZVR_C Chain C, Vipp1 [Nostoc p